MQNPVGTTLKVRSYVENLVKELSEGNLGINENDLVDIAGTLDTIHKVAEGYVKDLKKQLPLSANKKSIIGNSYLVTYNESKQRSIDPKTLLEQVGAQTFIQCVTVSIEKAKKVVPESTIDAIAIEGEPKVSISFKQK